MSPSLPPSPKRAPTFWSSLGHAWEGLVHTVAHQRNMRIHLSSAVMVGLVGMGIPLGLAEKVTLIFCVLLIFFAEVLNSALEHLVDLATTELDERARVAKDAAAAGVLVLATGTAVIFAALLVHNWDTVRTHVPQILRQVTLGLPLTACAALIAMPWKRPAWLDAALFVLGCGLLAALSLWSESYVFSAMTLGLLVLAGAASLELRWPRGPV